MEFDHANHVALWDWLVDNPECGKGNWPGWQRNGGTIPDIEEDADCFACQAGHRCITCEEATLCGSCEKECDCPLQWSTEGETAMGLACMADSSLYTAWFDESDIFLRRKYARQIRDLPLAEGWKA